MTTMTVAQPTSQPQAVIPTGKGNLLTTNATPEQALAIVQGAAAHLQFKLHQLGPAPTPWSFKAQKGSLVGGILLGALFAYCNFTVTVGASPDGSTVISIVRNVPWWTGAIGVMRVKNRADELGNAIGQGLVSSGFAVLSHSQT